jgi:PAS domain S-box-containing protein
MPEQDVKKLVHELQVHQIELEMQNAELHRTQLGLTEASDRYSDLYDFAPGALLTLSEHGAVLEANLSAAALLRLERRQLLQQKFTCFIPAEAQDTFHLYCQQVLHSGIKQIRELTLKSATGRRLTVRVEGIAALNPETYKRQCRLSLNDITASKQAEAALASSIARLNGVISSAMDAIISADARQHIVLFNQAAEKMFGISAPEALGQSLGRFIPERYRAAHVRHVSQYGETGVSNRSMGRLGALFGLRASGEEFPIEASISQVEIQGEKLFTVILRDITERKKAEAALQLKSNELARSNHDLEQFAHVASHDLQEPLRAVSGFVRLLQLRFPDKVDAKAAEYIKGASDGAERMERLILDLLDFSRVGTKGGDFVLVDLNALLGDALRTMQASLKTALAQVTHDDLPTLRADATQIGQLFQNLIGNAIKFRNDQPPQIHVGVRQEPERWVFSVRDNGIGIEPQYFERIFQIFQRLHTRKHYRGTGIGLPICKRVVERHGGTIWVESQPGQGSTFYFSIPKSSG